jgi:hypothetical protein
MESTGRYRSDSCRLSGGWTDAWGVLLPETPAMDDVAAALDAPVTRYEGIHDAVP